MGANAQTSVPTFTAGDVLTAANMNISARTGVPVFADTTARDAAFGGTGEKTLAEGQLCYVENLTGDAQIQYYDGSAWNSLGSAGLTLVSATTIGSAVSSVTVSNAFSATYDNYRILVTGGTASATTDLRLTLGASATGYYFGGIENSFASATVASSRASNGTHFRCGGASSNGLLAFIELSNPFAAKITGYAAQFSATVTSGEGFSNSGFHDSAVSYTAFTLTPGTGTLTGGTIRVYGYRN